MGAYFQLMHGKMFGIDKATGAIMRLARPGLGVTAHAGGGQTNALPIVSAVTRVTTVASAGDSVKLPSIAAIPEQAPEYIIINSGANPMQVFGSGTDTVNDAASGTGISQPQNSIGYYVAGASGKWYGNIVGFSAAGLETETAVTGLTALSGGGQSGATALTGQINSVDTVAAAGDSVALPAAAAGSWVMVINNTTKPMQVFGAGTDTINGVATATGISQPPNSVDIYICAASGKWVVEAGQGYSGGLNTVSATDSITAAGSTQGAATALTTDFNRVTTATALQGVKLPASAPGLDIIIVNHSGAAITVYGAGSDKIDDQTATVGVVQMNNSVVLYTCYAAGNWYSEGLATGFGGPGLQTISFADALTAVGSGQSTALALTAMLNRVTAGASTTGVNLPTSAAGMMVTIINAVANAINVYPAQGASDTINGIAAATGVVQMSNSTVTYYCTAAGTWVALGLGQGFSGQLSTMSFADAQTAAHPGAQGSAPLVSTEIARFTTVANQGDSTTLPTAAPGLMITVINDAAANTMAVYPASGDAINVQSANAAFPLPAGTTVTFYCTVAAKWHTMVTAQGKSVSPRLFHSGGRAPATNSDFTNTTPASTTTYVCEVFVAQACTATGIAIVNGTAVSGNVKVYLADSNGQQLAASASTAQSGTSAYQRIAFTSALFLAPGTYFIVLQIDNATGRIATHPFGDFGAASITSTTYGTYPTVTPPTTFTTNVGPVAHLYA